MRVRRRPRIVFCTAAAVIAACGLTLVDAAGAAPGQGGASPAKVCIEPTIRFGEAPDAPSVVTRTIPGGLPAGRYRVSATTSDGYPGRTETAFDIETSERVTVYGHVTEDLADGVESDTKTLVFEVSFTQPQTTVEVAHTPANGPDSVRVDALCWERLGDVEIPTSTSTTAAGSTTTVPGVMLQTVPSLVFLEGDPATSTTAAPSTTTCISQGGTAASGGAAGSTTTGAGVACPGSTIALGSQLPLAPTANVVAASPAFTG